MAGGERMETPSFMGRRNIFLKMVVLILALSDSTVHVLGTGVGINYGRIANNLPTPAQVAMLLQSLNINRVKLYDADPTVLRAFAGSNVEFIIGLGNGDLANVANPSNAVAWIQQNVQPFIAQTKITTINVGNEVFASNDTQFMSSLLPAMQSMYNALTTLGLNDQVTVTTAHSLNILATSFPPSSGAFQESLAQYLQPLVDFHARIKSPFLINAYPFFAYKDSPQQVPLSYVLFQPNQGTVDPNTNLKYDNMLYAQIDAVYAAIKAMGHTNIEVRVSETGWPSMGDSDEVGATPGNAAMYNGNLMRRIRRQETTPGRPSVALDVHVFALFNENQKPGPTSERNYGLLFPDGRSVYNLGLQTQGSLLEISASSPMTNAFWSIILLIFVGVLLI